MEKARNKRKQRYGVVTSDKMNKTRVVRVERLVKHPRYTRIVRKAVKFKVHDEQNASKVGDKVRIMETRPISKDKRWTVMEILK